MAVKYPICLYSGEYKELQAGDSVAGVYFGTERYDVASLGLSTTTLASYQLKLTLTTGNLVVGARYRLGWYWEMTSASTAVSVHGRVQIDNALTETTTIWAPQAIGNWLGVGGFAYYTSPDANTHFVDIDFQSGTAGTFVGIQKARLEWWRVV